jgi:hypothetical protein
VIEELRVNGDDGVDPFAAFLSEQLGVHDFLDVVVGERFRVVPSWLGS